MSYLIRFWQQTCWGEGKNRRCHFPEWKGHRDIIIYSWFMIYTIMRQLEVVWMFKRMQWIGMVNWSSEKDSKTMTVFEHHCVRLWNVTLNFCNVDMLCTSLDIDTGRLLFNIKDGPESKSCDSLSRSISIFLMDYRPWTIDVRIHNYKTNWLPYFLNHK